MKASLVTERKFVDPSVRCVDEPQADQPVWDRSQRVHRAVHQDRVAAPPLHCDHHATRHDKATAFKLAILDEQRQIIHAIFRGQAQTLFFVVGYQQCPGQA